MTDFKDILNKKAKVIEAEFDKALPDTNLPYNEVIRAMKYSLKIGGKRIRPILLLEFYKLCGGTDLSAMNFAVALEMIHTYSLIHDDLPCMDNDDFRRGKPSCHKQFSESTAVLAGDALLTEAFGYAAKTDNICKKNIINALTVLSANAGTDGMVGGQIIDIANEGKTVTAEQLKYMYSLKTGALIKSACVIGCILAGAYDKIPYAEQYAESVGLAFQITDDILDCTSDEKTLGKPIGSDEKNNKSTFVSLYGIEKCKSIVAELTETAKSLIDNFEGNGKFLKEIADYLAFRKY